MSCRHAHIHGTCVHGLHTHIYASAHGGGYRLFENRHRSRQTRLALQKRVWCPEELGCRRPTFITHFSEGFRFITGRCSFFQLKTDEWRKRNWSGGKELRREAGPPLLILALPRSEDSGTTQERKHKPVMGWFSSDDAPVPGKPGSLLSQPREQLGSRIP